MLHTYKNSKLLLTASLLENYPLADKSEIEAIASHWLHAQKSPVPLLNSSMQQLCIDKFYQNSKETPTLKTKQTAKQQQLHLHIDWDGIPFMPTEKPKFKFIDLFAGIGGFRLAMQEQGGKCVFSSEWDSDAKKTYEANFGEVPYGDIRNIHETDIPDHDILCAGFPCQPFSLAGVSARSSRNTAHGFACETQGTLFFDIARILKEKRPKFAFLENVRNLVRHDDGKTFAIIRNTIESLGYSFSYKLIDSSPLVPQKRVRCYMVCIRDDASEFEFPVVQGEPLTLRSILEDTVAEHYTISAKLWEGHQRRTNNNIARGTGFTAFCADLDKPSKTIVARYGKDGKECLIPQANKTPRMLTPRECARLQGFPESYIIPVAKSAAYRQFGNSVAVPVIRTIARKLVTHL